MSRLQQQRVNIGLERIHLDNISPFKLFGLSLVGVSEYLCSTLLVTTLYTLYIHYTVHYTIHCTLHYTLCITVHTVHYTLQPIHYRSLWSGL